MINLKKDKIKKDNKIKSSKKVKKNKSSSTSWFPETFAVIGEIVGESFGAILEGIDF